MKQIIPAGEFKAKCLHLMDEVQQHHRSIIITKYGKPIAKLVPFTQRNDAKAKDLFGYMKNTVTILGDIVSPIDETWDVEQDD